MHIARLFLLPLFLLSSNLLATHLSTCLNTTLDLLAGSQCQLGPNKIASFPTSTLLFDSTASNTTAATSAGINVSFDLTDPLNPGISFTSTTAFTISNQSAQGNPTRSRTIWIGYTITEDPSSLRLLDGATLLANTSITGTVNNIGDASLSVDKILCLGATFGGTVQNPTCSGTQATISHAFGGAAGSNNFSQFSNFTPDIATLSVIDKVVLNVRDHPNQARTVQVSNVDNYFLQTGVIPEPSAALLLGTGLLAFGAVRRIRRRG